MVTIRHDMETHMHTTDTSRKQKGSATLLRLSARLGTALRRPAHAVGLMFALTLGQSVLAGPIDTLPARHWLELPNTQMSQVYPNPVPAGTTGPDAVMSAWCGGAFDTMRNRFIAWCGGHFDYSGNEMYVFDVETATWTRLTEPTTPVEVGVGRYWDGRPAPRHTYDYVEYVPSIDAFIVAGGGGYGSGVTHQNVEWFSFAINDWISKQDHPDMGGNIGRVSALDPVTGHVWFHGTTRTGKLAEYDPIADRWTVYSGAEIQGDNSNAAIAPDRRIMVAIGPVHAGGPPIYVWDLNNPSAKPTSPTTTGDDTLLQASYPAGWEYDPVLRKFVGWNGGGQVYTLDPDTWAWERIDPAPTNTVIPTEPESTGTYSRFRYMPAYNAYILANRTTDNIFIYRLTDATPPPVPQTPPQPTVDVQRSAP